MAKAARIICDGAALADGGKGVRFTFDRYGAAVSAFAVRYDGKAYAYLNSCAHIPIELDSLEGEFFDEFGLYLICSTHGAVYEPETGHCIMGPCKGQHLIALRVEERDGKVYLIGDGNYNG